MTWAGVVVVVVAAALILPAAAAAHGRGTPVATNWRVQWTHVPDAVRAIPVDGDRDLWLRVAPHHTLFVLGALGERMLRFGPAGVFVNRASLTAESDGIIRTTATGWHRLGGGRSLRWHEHRLHLLEPVGGGRFAVPLRLDGRPAAIEGSLRRVDGRPSWPWLLLGAAVLVVGVLIRPLRLAAVAAGTAAGAVSIGQSLHGRPFIAAGGVVDATLAAVLVLLLVVAVVAARSPEGRALAALFLGIGAVVKAVVMTPVLTHAVALNDLGTQLARAFVAVACSAGLVAAVLGFRGLIREEAS